MNGFLQCGHTTDRDGFSAAPPVTWSTIPGVPHGSGGWKLAAAGIHRIVMLAVTQWVWIVLIIVGLLAVLAFIGNWRAGARP